MDANRTGAAEINRAIEQRNEKSHGLRLLWIGPEEPSWVGIALRLDAEGILEPRFQWAARPTDALAALRDEVFDCIVVGENEQSRVADDPAVLVRAVRGSGYSGPVIFVGARVDDYRVAQLCELDCDVLVTPNSYDSPALLPSIRRAMSHAERGRENQRLSVVHHRRLVRDRAEAEQLLQQQRSIISSLETSIGGRDASEDPASMLCPAPIGEMAGDRPELTLPIEMGEFYHELLRTFVMMGSGSLASDIAGFARLMSTAGISMRQALQFHLERVESLVRDLGSRSTRHVIARADLLALELMVHLGEEYRKAGQVERGI